MSPVRWQGNTLVLELHVQPGAKRDEIVGTHGDRLKFKISAPPVDGKANRHLIDFLASTFGVPKSHVTLVRGETSRLKTVQIRSPQILPEEFQLPPRT